LASGDDRRGDELELRELELEAVHQRSFELSWIAIPDTGYTVILAS
jgi:hypothetical protein